MTRRKDRVLNTRIPEELDREIREQAERLDVSVSQFVRDVLERTVNLVGNFSGNVEHLVADIVDDVGHFKSIGVPDKGEREPLAREIGRSVVGWQEIRVNRAVRCPLTGRMLSPGESAHLGIRTSGKPSIVISPEALDELMTPRGVQWVPLVLQNTTRCARTGREMEPGERAWFDPAGTPPTFICEEAHQSLYEGEPEETDR